jgi:hypothetical protein
MTAAQSRLADTIEAFYGSADKASEGAMAGHAYKRSVDDLDGVVGRELVGLFLPACLALTDRCNVFAIGPTISNNDI